jgi:hypothetical protein
MNEIGLPWDVLLYALFYGLLYLVGLVCCVQFRRVSPSMRLLVGGFGAGLALMLLQLGFGLVGGWSREVAQIGQLLCFTLIVVGMACVFSDLRDRLPRDWEPIETERPSDLHLLGDADDLPGKKRSEQVQTEEPGS